MMLTGQAGGVAQGWGKSPPLKGLRGEVVRSELAHYTGVPE